MGDAVYSGDALEILLVVWMRALLVHGTHWGPRKRARELLDEALQCLAMGGRWWHGRLAATIQPFPSLSPFRHSNSDRCFFVLNCASQIPTGRGTFTRIPNGRRCLQLGVPMDADTSNLENHCKQDATSCSLRLSPLDLVAARPWRKALCQIKRWISEACDRNKIRINYYDQIRN